MTWSRSRRRASRTPKSTPLTISVTIFFFALGLLRSAFAARARVRYAALTASHALAAPAQLGSHQALSIDVPAWVVIAILVLDNVLDDFHLFAHQEDQFGRVCMDL